jgi:hypothetical protein
MQRWWNRHDYFGWFQVADASIPRWHLNPFNGAEVPEAMRPWWLIPDFDERVGDIKTIWEASRFDWLMTFAQHARHGDPAALERLNTWLDDWLHHNPPYLGPNWKCGQEASIRVMHLAVAALILDQWRAPTASLRALVRAHLQRIAPTIQYAIAQDNNHGTSEAAALFIGGSWLAALGDRTGERWSGLGRRWLENRAARLIAADGSFSQYSVNYHRLMLDTYSLVEHWRRTLDLPAFSPLLKTRLAAATDWLYQMTQPETGDAPVLGANDGARLIPLVDTDYRDYRPCVQLAMALFADRRAYPVSGDWNHPLTWLGIPTPTHVAAPVTSTQYDQGGYSMIRTQHAFVLLRYPRFRRQGRGEGRGDFSRPGFRPSQADALHLDLWLNGQNLLRDAGSYSYNMGENWLRYFSGTASHNSIQFDDRDQMPRLDRFLFGDWLQADTVTPITTADDALTTSAGYTDGQGATHRRHVQLTPTHLRIEDSVCGFTQKAVLRWRLSPGDWIPESDSVRLGGHRLQINATVPMQPLRLISGWESRYYLRKDPVPVLEVEIRKPGKVISEYWFDA